MHLKHINADLYQTFQNPNFFILCTWNLFPIWIIISQTGYNIPFGRFNAFSSVGVRQKVFVIKNELVFYYKNIDILLFVVKDSLENVWDHLLVKIQYLFHPLSSELAFASYALNLFLSNTRMQCLINMNCKQLSIQNFTSIFDSVDEFGRLKVNQYIWHEEMG